MNEPYLMPLMPGHVDLRPLIDDKRVLKNPHKGWYVHYVDNGFCRKIYRDGIAPGDYLHDFPGLDHLYLRLDWSDIEPKEGELDWSQVDAIMDEWGEQGYHFAFRLCCYVPSNPYATPEWVRLAGAKGTMIPPVPPRSPLIPSATTDKWEPDYGDPIFLEKLENFIAAFAAKYDTDPRVEFVDVGSYGSYGEGHTHAGSMTKFPASVIRKHLDIHLRHFRHTTLLMNDDLFSSAAEGSGIPAAHELADYAAAKGMGARDDSICVSGYVSAFGYDTLKNGPFFDKFYETAPVDLEMAHFHLSTEERIAEGLPLIEALKRTHATYVGFHGHPRPWYDAYPYLTRYVANRVGYWYFPTELEITECVSGMDTLIRLRVENRGFARAYHPFTLIFRAVDAAGQAYELSRREGANLRWLEGESTVERARLNFDGVPAGQYALEVGLFENDRAIEWAVKENLCRDGFVTLTTIDVTSGSR